MPFGRKTERECRVYEYGCLAPVQGEKELVDAVFNRNQLWNKLVEIDRSFEEKFCALTRESVERIGFDPDEFETLEREVAFLRDLKEVFGDEIKQRRQRARSGQVGLSDLEPHRDRVKACFKEKNARHREAKRLAREANRAAFDALEAERKEAVKAALHSVDLWWCNWGEEHVEYETARKKVLQDRTKGKPVSLRFHRFDGSGKVTVRLRERGMAGPWGMPVENVFRPNNAFWIEPVPVEAWEHPVRAVRRKKAQTKAHFRIGSDGRDPIWVVLPMVMHRPLPGGCLVRQAALVRKRVGRSFRYKLVVTVELMENSRAPLTRDGAVAVDIGWRKVEDGVRVAYWADGKGNRGELVLPDKMVRAFQKLRDLRSVRDVHFDEAKKVLLQFLERNSAPEWLREKLRNLDRWRSQGKLIAVLDEWERNRFVGDGVFEWLREWQKREDHLYDWEGNLRDQVLRWRREEYRKFAKRLAENYGAVILEDFDLRKVAEKPAPEEGTQGSIPPDYQRFVAAPSELRLCVKNACAREGAEITYESSAFTTLRCYACGYTEKFDAAKDIWRRCPNPKCGELWDQDYNACANLLKQYFSKEKAAS